MKANLVTVKVVPRGFKAIPGILADCKLIQGEPMELELSKDEIHRCMNYADVYDLTSGEEVLIDEVSFKEIVEYVEDEEETEVEEELEDEEPVETETTEDPESGEEDPDKEPVEEE